MSEALDLPETGQLLEVTTERASPSDAAAIMTLKRTAWLDAYVSEEHGITPEDIEKKFPADSLPEAIANWEKGIASESDRGDRVTFVARINGTVVGYTSPTHEDGQKRIGALYVHPDAQGSGIGGKLLQQAIAWHGRAENIYLHVVSYNQNAISFYKSNGFQATGTVFPEAFDTEKGLKLLPEIEMVLPGQTN